MPTIYFGSISKKRNSTLQPTLTSSYDCIIKQPASIDNPTFVIQDATFNMMFNYAKWDNTYYFIEDIVSVRNDIWEVSCVIDVLATYKTDILASTQYVCYSSQSGDSWLEDMRIPLKASETVSANSALTGILSTIGCYILSVVGVDSVSTYKFHSDAPIAAMLADLQTWRDNLEQSTQAIASSYQGSASGTGSDAGSASSNDNEGIGKAISNTIANLGNALASTLISGAKSINDSLKTISDAMVQTGFVGNAYENAIQCIRSCIWVPFDYALSPSGSGSSPIMLGTYPTNTSASSVGSTPAPGSFSISIPWQHSDWRRKTCEDVYLYLPLVGMVQLSGDSLISETTLNIDWAVTYTDGVICYKVKAGNQVIGAFSGQCAVNYPIGIAQQASAGSVVTSAVQGVQKTVSGAINAAAVGGGVGAVLGGIVGAASAGYNVANTMNSTHISTVGNIGGGAGLGLGREAVCYTVSHDTIIAPSDMKATMGVPTMKPMALSTLTGYCQCANAHVAASGAMAEELDAIDIYLNTGFYIE